MPRAKVLAHFLKEKGELTAREIERATDLRQPEVSLALGAFIERKWITEQKQKSDTTKGRPSKVYVLSIPPETLFQSIESGVTKELKERQDLLKELKSVMMVVKTVQPEIPHVTGKQLTIG